MDGASASDASPAEAASGVEEAEVEAPVFPARSVSVADFGAVSDGRRLNTEAFARAIDRCHEAGGGTVHVPPGIWLTGPMRLRSGVNLCLAEDAEIRFSSDRALYKSLVLSRWEGVECRNCHPLIHAAGSRDVAITGKGVLNGQGKAWEELLERGKASSSKLREMGENGVPVEERVFGPDDGLRPSLFLAVGCKGVLIEGVTIVDPPMWAAHPLYCEDVLVRSLKVFSEGIRNGDGVDPDSCRNVVIEDCAFQTGDDCIALKSGRDADGRRVGAPCEGVAVRRCVAKAGHGGVSIGSEMSGGAKNVSVRDCRFCGVDYGVRIKTMRGRGGAMEGILVQDVRMENVRRAAFQVSMRYREAPEAPASVKTPSIKGVVFRNLSCDSKGKAYAIAGLEEMPVENVVLENVSIRSKFGAKIKHARNLLLRNVEMKVETPPEILMENVAGLKTEG